MKIIYSIYIRYNYIRNTIPHAKKCQDDGNVLLQGFCAEMVVHEVGAFEKLLEVVETHVESNGQSDGGPQGIPEKHKF